MRFDSGALMTLIRSTISFLQSIEAKIPVGAPPAGSPAPKPPPVLPPAPPPPPVQQGPNFYPMTVTAGTDVTLALPTTATNLIGEILDEGNPVESIRTTTWQVVSKPYGAKVTFTPYTILDTDTSSTVSPLVATSLSFDYIGGRIFSGGNSTDRAYFGDSTGLAGLNTGAFTYSAIARITAIDTTFRRLISKENVPQTKGWNVSAVVLNGANVLVMNNSFSGNAANSQAQWSWPAPTLNTDFHLSIRANGVSAGSTPRVQINLTDQTVTTVIAGIGNAVSDTGCGLLIGNRDQQPNRAFAGRIYYSRLWGGELDQQLLNQEHNDPGGIGDGAGGHRLWLDDTPKTTMAAGSHTLIGAVETRTSPTIGNAATNTGTYVFRLVGTSEFMFHEKVNYLIRGSNVTVVVNPVGNVAPVVDAGTNLTITLPATGVVVGTVSDDGLPASPGSTTSTWSLQDGPGTITFSNTANLSSSVTASTHGTYTLKLAASDGALGSADSMTLTVSPQVPINVAPTVELGPSLSVVYPATAIVIGTVTDDGLPNPPGALTLTWSRVSGPGTITFSNTAATTTSLTFATSGNYIIQLLAADSLLSGSDQLVASVFPPIASQGTLTLSLNRSITF